MNNTFLQKGPRALFLLLALFLFIQAQAQEQTSNLPVITIVPNSTLHFVSPQKIRYVDISSHAVAGDLPEEKILRIRLNSDSLSKIPGSGIIGIVTIVGENYMAQYRLFYSPFADIQCLPTRIDIIPDQASSLDTQEGALTSTEMKTHAMNILKNRKKRIIQSTSAYGIKLAVNHIYTIGNNVFLDLTVENSTNLRYDLDEVRFKIEDRKIVKATNVQSVELKPLWQLYGLDSFKRIYRNIYVLEKMTFPENKVLKIELSEKQISGRTITLKINYGDLLNADTF